MGSSAMGAGVLRKKIQDAGLSRYFVINSAIQQPAARCGPRHHYWRPDRTRYARVPQAQQISLTNLHSGLYTSLTERLVAAQRHTANEEK